MNNDLVIRRLSEQVSIDASDPIAKLSGLEQLQRAARKAQAAFGEPPPGRGRPREVHKSNFFEGTVAIVKAFRGNLGLPQYGRDEAATTGAHAFAEARRRAKFLSLALALLPLPAAAEPILQGAAPVIDGDTVVVKGVDAAEVGTARGEHARRVMATIVTGELSCRLTGEKTHRREVSFCFTSDGTDIGQALIVGDFADEIARRGLLETVS